MESVVRRRQASLQEHRSRVALRLNDGENKLRPESTDVELTLRAAGEIYRQIFGHRPRRFAMPVWIFQRLAGSASKQHRQTPA